MVSGVNYKQRLMHARELRGVSGYGAYDRMKLLMAVYLDPEFRLDHGGDEDRMVSVLDDHIQDLFLGFRDMSALVDRYPDREKWKDGKLRRMYEDMLSEKERAAATGNMRKQAPPSGPQRSAMDRVMDANELESLRRDNESLHRELSELRAKWSPEQEKARLRKENERIRSEIERMKKKPRRATAKV